MKCFGSIAVAALFCVVLSEASFAQSGRGHPDCRKFRDQQSCNCAVSNGGRVFDDPHRPGRKRWEAPRSGTGAHMAYMTCSTRGRHGSVDRPQLRFI